MILSLDVLTEYMNITDTPTDRQTRDDSTYHANIATAIYCLQCATKFALLQKLYDLSSQNTPLFLHENMTSAVTTYFRC